MNEFTQVEFLSWFSGTLFPSPNNKEVGTQEPENENNKFLSST
jgi:hypothetical protein